MRHLKTTDITDTNALPVKSGTLDHLQLAYAEAIAEAVKGFIGSAYDSTKVYLLHGCVNSGSGSSYVISAGSVFFNGEVYLVDAASFTIAGSNVAVGSIFTGIFADATADPVTFTDGVARNIHQIKKIAYAAALSGSGAGDFSDLHHVNVNIAQLNLTGTGIATISGTYPNKNVDVPAPAVSILASGLTNVGDISPSAGTTITVSFSSVGTASYIVAGSVESFGTPTNDVLVVYGITNKTATSFDIHFQELSAVAQNIKFGWALIKI